MAEQTAAEWAASLTPDQTLALVHRTLEARDMEGTALALRLLAVKDPRAAETILSTIELLAPT